MDLIGFYWKEFNTVSLLIFMSVLCRDFPKRCRAGIRRSLGSIGLLVYSGIFMSSWQIGEGQVFAAVVINVAAKLVAIGLILLLFWCVYDLEWTDLCLAGIISVASAHLTYSIRNFLVSVFPLFRTNGGRILDILISTLLTAAAAWGLCLVFQGSRSIAYARFRNRGTLLISGLALLLSNSAVIYLHVGSAGEMTPGTEQVLCFYEILFNLLMLYMLYSVVYRGTLYYERNMLKEIARQRKAQYEFSRSMIDTIDIKSHDLKKQIRYLRKNADTPENSRFVQELDRCVTEYDSIIQTSHPTLSTILTEKSMVCTRKGIEFSCIADGTEIGFMENLDIYTLFANLLDNAIEAVADLPGDRRSIALNVSTKNSFISIHEENYHSGAVRMVGGRPATTKEDKREHGFGTRSMEVITEKYDGTISFRALGDMFQTNILIPIP